MSRFSVLRLIAWALVAACAGPLSASAQTGAPGDLYRVQPGDVLQVSVWKEEDLQREVLVRPDGGISFPLAGDIMASGMTLEEVRNAVAERLGKYIPDAEVSVAVSELIGNKIYVEGKVNRPGEFMVTRPVDVMQALSMAGGVSVFAERNEIKVLRRVEGRQVALPFRYADVVNGESLEQNIVLQSGDIVVVP